MPKSKFVWKDEHILFIIEKIKACNFMWDLNHISYKNKSKKHLFWTKMIDELNTTFRTDGNFSHDDVVRKWNNVKIYFMTESQKVSGSIRSGKDTDAIVESSWRFYDRLLFLKQTCQAMPSINNYNKQSLNELSRDSTLNELNSSSNELLWSQYEDVEFLDFDDNATSEYVRNVTPDNLISASPTNTKITESPSIAIPQGDSWTNEQSMSSIYLTSTSTSSSSKSQSRSATPSPLHPTKKSRMKSKSKEEILADSCLQSSLQLTSLMQASQKKTVSKLSLSM